MSDGKKNSKGDYRLLSILNEDDYIRDENENSLFEELYLKYKNYKFNLIFSYPI